LLKNLSIDFNRIRQKIGVQKDIYSMKAVVYIGNGRFELVEKSVPKPLPGESLIEMSRAGICGTDVRIFQGHMLERVGSRRVLGHEAVSIVRETSADKRLPAGSRVVMEPTLFCGRCAACRQGFSNVCQNLQIIGIDRDGAFQQFLSVPENRLHLVPASVSDDDAVMIEPLAVAVHSIRVASLCPGETALIIGAGTIGLLIATLAGKAGVRVVLLETNPARRDFARRLNLNAVDSARDDLAEFLADFAGGPGANVVFEASGSASGSRLMTSLAAVRGRIVLVGIHDQKTPTDLYRIFSHELSIQGVRAYSRADFEEAIQLMATGKMDVGPMISGQFPLEQLQQAVELAVSGSQAVKILVGF
jgi:(R,R)-butanediol dehydrogenase / meso-butanediol dehydrogenase / diacetyl reductase